MGSIADSDRLYEEAACGLLVTDAKGDILRVNRTFCAWLGRSPQDLVGSRLQSVLSIGARIFHQTHWEPLLKMQGSLAEVKLEMLHVDGRKIPMVMNAVVRSTADGELHELAVFSARDRHRYEQELLLARRHTEEHLERERASQRRLAETQARLELAIDAALLYQWSVEMPGAERHYGPEVALLVGMDTPRAMDAAEFLDHVEPADRERERREVERFLESGAERFHTIFRLIRLDGSARWIAASARMRFDAAGVPSALVGVLQDVTESHRQRALAEDRALLAEQTLGIVGHDLRNPLSAIQTGAELLARRPLDADQQRALALRMQSSIRRANRLIADLLDFTQARNGRGLRLTKSPVDAHSIAREVVAELSSAYPSCRLRHDATGDGALVADGDRLVQALGNLVSNALTYGLDGTEVTLTSTGAQGMVRFTVHNEGPPIDPRLKATLFEPMTRGENPGHLRSVGLGLYIVREIALAHGGTVECVSEASSGTTFSLNVPR